MTAGLYMHKHGLDFAPAQLRVRRKIAWIDLVRPPHGYVFLCHSIQQGMAIYQWMVRTGAPFRGMYEALSCKGTCVNMTKPDAFTRSWRSELRDRVCAAILDPIVHGPVLEWREKFRVGVEHERVVPIKHYSGGGPDGSDDATAKRLDSVFQIVGRTLAVSHNEYHPKARTIVGVELHVRAMSYALEILYGYPSDLRGGSSWSLTVEAFGPFLDFISHCERELARLLLADATIAAGEYGISIGTIGKMRGWFGDSCDDEDEILDDEEPGKPRAPMAVSAFIEQQIAELIERFDYLVTLDDVPAFSEAIQALGEFLADQLGEHDWPLAVFCRDGEHNWAFAVLAFDTTSYIHVGAGDRPRVEWYGTTWEPGCECGEPLEDGSDVLGSDDEHRADCPARRNP